MIFIGDSSAVLLGATGILVVPFFFRAVVFFFVVFFAVVFVIDFFDLAGDADDCVDDCAVQATDR